MSENSITCSCRRVAHIGTAYVTLQICICWNKKVWELLELDDIIIILLSCTEIAHTYTLNVGMYKDERNRDRSLVRLYVITL